MTTFVSFFIMEVFSITNGELTRPETKSFALATSSCSQVSEIKDHYMTCSSETLIAIK